MQLETIPVMYEREDSFYKSASSLKDHKKTNYKTVATSEGQNDQQPDTEQRAKADMSSTVHSGGHTRHGDTENTNCDPGHLSSETRPLQRLSPEGSDYPGVTNQGLSHEAHRATASAGDDTADGTHGQDRPGTAEKESKLKKLRKLYNVYAWLYFFLSSKSLKCLHCQRL